MRVTKEQSEIIRDLIHLNGGVTHVAKSLSNIFEEQYTKQRVCNWYRQGIPPKVAKVLVMGTDITLEELY